GIGFKLGEIEIPHLTFADDLNIVTFSDETEQKGLQIIEEFCLATKMEINLEKTVRSSLNGPKSQPNIVYKGKLVRTVGPEETVRLLGAKRNLTMTWGEE